MVGYEGCRCRMVGYLRCTVYRGIIVSQLVHLNQLCISTLLLPFNISKFNARTSSLHFLSAHKKRQENFSLSPCLLHKIVTNNNGGYI